MSQKRPSKGKSGCLSQTKFINVSLRFFRAEAQHGVPTQPPQFTPALAGQAFWGHPKNFRVGWRSAFHPPPGDAEVKSRLSTRLCSEVTELTGTGAALEGGLATSPF